MTLVAGSYERFLFGYSLPEAEEAAGPAQQQPPRRLERRFTHAAHKGVVKCLAAAGQFLASGGADDLIHLYDLKTDKDLSFLMNPGEGAVTALEFFVPPGAYNPTHLLSGSADGSVSVWSVGGGWECMKTMRGHRKQVNSISVHPSGALALTCSRDGTLRMWDLVKGRSTFSTKLEAEAEEVHFSPSGATYALLCGSRVTLHAIGAGQGLVGELPHARRGLCMLYSPDGHFLLTGGEDGSLRVWSTKTSEELLCVPRAHATRIRGLALPTPPSPAARPATPGLLPLVATASSDGVIKLWSLTAANLGGTAAEAAAGASCVAEAATTARLTSLAALDPPAVMEQRLRESRKLASARQSGGDTGPSKAARGGGKAAAGGGGGSRSGKQQQQGQQQERQQPGKKKRRQAEAAGGTVGTADAGKQRRQQPAAPKPARQQGLQQPPQPQQQLAALSAERPTKKPKLPKDTGSGAAAGAGAEAAGGVAKGGVVDFMDAKDWQRARQKKKKQRAKHAVAAEQAQQGGRGGTAGGRRPKGKGGSSLKPR